MTALHRSVWILPRLFALVALLQLAGCAREEGPRSFSSPEDAFGAFVAAMRDSDVDELVSILGPEGEPLITSADPEQNRSLRTRFLAAYDAAHQIEKGDSDAVLYVGVDEFPFPIPVVLDESSWHFDTAAADDEILSRRIGRNELAAIQVCLAYVDAQREYYAQDRDGDGILEYAQRAESAEGQRDGLYWETKPGEEPSPLGDLIAYARAEGYRPGEGDGPRPYHGYYYRGLHAQGPAASGGALDYIADGQMIGGFGLVAYPAEYGLSGVMTFIVSHDGVVYEKELGPETAKIAAQMDKFDPDAGWQQVEREALEPSADPGEDD